MNEARWLKYAWREFGQSERRGAQHNQRIVALFRDVGHAKVVRDEVAWCAAYCGACLERAGIPSTRSLMARSYMTWGKALSEPRVGAIAVFSRGANPALGHVGFWLGETDSDVVVLGGNQSDAVTVARYPKRRLLALRWPPQADPATKKQAKPVSDQPSEPIPANVPRAAGEQNFERALAHVLKMEGGFTDDPYDPGGPTNKGVTLAVFASWRKVALNAASRARLIRELKTIDSATVREIYRRRYWLLARCAELPAPLAFMHFDAAVNHGVGAAARMLQEALGVRIDGKIGPETRAAAARAALLQTLAAYAAIREQRYRALPHFWRFGRGWLRRVAATRARAEALAVETRSNAAQEQGDIDMTTRPTDPNAAKWWGHSVTIWGTIVTVLSAVLPAVAPVTGIDVTGDLVRTAGEQVYQAVQAAGALVGTLMTIYGRMRATRPIGPSLFKPEG